MLRIILLITLFLSLPLRAADIAVFESRDTPIAEFVSWFATYTGQTVVLGQGVTGKVSFTAPELKQSEYSAFFNSVLRSHGYQLDFSKGVYTVSVNVDELDPMQPPAVKLYRFENVRNTKVTELINSMLSATEIQRGEKQSKPQYDVQILPTTNSIIVTGTPDQITKMDALIAGIDRPQKQVFIEAIITETELGDNKELAVNLEAAFEHAGFVTQPIAIDKAVDNLLFYERGDFSALVKAVQSNENTELLSRPSMLIMDREKGYITVGQNVPFLVSSESTDNGGTIQRIERKDVGVSLEVIPHVIGNDVVLIINQESSSVTNSAIASDIITNKRTLQTVVQVSDLQTIALGGLISNEERASVSGVPVLMDIPLLGALFRSESKSQIKKELKVVIKTTIL